MRVYNKQLIVYIGQCVIFSAIDVAKLLTNDIYLGTLKLVFRQKFSYWIPRQLRSTKYIWTIINNLRIRNVKISMHEEIFVI